MNPDVVDDPLDNIEEHEYPSGFRLAAIVAALILSIFLVSLAFCFHQGNEAQLIFDFKASLDTVSIISFLKIYRATKLIQ